MPRQLPNSRRTRSCEMPFTPFGQRGGELAVAPAHRLDAVHEVNRDVAIVRERQHMIIEIRRARSRDGDLFRPCRSGHEQPAHPAERLDHFVMRVGTGIEDGLGVAGRLGADFHTAVS